MNRIMTFIAESLEILRRVFTPINLLHFMMELQKTWLRGGPRLAAPAASNTFISVPFKYGSPNLIRDVSIMDDSRASALEHILTDNQIRSAGHVSGDRPPLLGTQFPDPPCHFHRLIRHVPQFLARNRFPDIEFQELKDRVFYTQVFPSD